MLARRCPSLVVWIALSCFAISPCAIAQGWQHIGKVTKVEKLPDGVELTAGKSKVRITAFREGIVRVRVAPTGVFPKDFSWAIVEAPQSPAVKIDDAKDELRMTAGDIVVRVNKSPLLISFSDNAGSTLIADEASLPMAWNGDHIQVWKDLPPDENFYGLGDKAGPMNRRGRAFVNWNTDEFGWQESSDPLYKTIPFFLGEQHGTFYGLFFDNTYRSSFDFGKEARDYFSFGAEGGEINYYFLAGPEPGKIVQEFADMAGHTPLPPLWTLGYQQSRYSYYPQDHLRDIARELRARHIPCDVLYLDIDYMDGFRDFTWSPRRYPDPAGLLAELRALGFQVITIIDPGVKLDPTDPTFAEGLERGYFVRMPDGTLFTGAVWPGECVFPDFSRDDVRRWWGERHRALLAPGVAGIWDDMNEPALITDVTPGRGVTQATMDPDAVHIAGGEDGPLLRHAAFHNAYGLEMARATREGLERLQPDRRHVVLSRSGTAGIQRYSATWTGDNMSIWPHLRLALRMCLNLGLSGVPFVGADVGGFGGDATGPLLARFTQLGALMPFFRNHSDQFSRPQEPWAFGQPFEACCRGAIELRYRLLPYLYTCFEHAATEGVPIMRALAYAFPRDARAAALDDQLLLGDALLAAPVLDEGAVARPVYFPEGTWAELWTGERIVGPVTRRVDAPLDMLPLYAREGTIIPFGPLLQYTDQRPSDPLTLAVYLGDARSRAQGELYEDDGRTPAYRNGVSRRTQIDASREPGQVRVRLETPSGAYNPGTHAWIVELRLALPGPHRHWQPRAVRIGPVELARGDAPTPGREPDASEPPAWSTVERRYETVVRVALGRREAPFEVTVDLA